MSNNTTSTTINNNYRQVSPHAGAEKLDEALQQAFDARLVREQMRKDLLQQLADLDREDCADMAFAMRVAAMLNSKRAAA